MPYPPPLVARDGNGIAITFAVLGVLVVVFAAAIIVGVNINDSSASAQPAGYPTQPTAEQQPEQPSSPPSTSTSSSRPSTSSSRPSSPSSRSSGGSSAPAKLADNPLFANANAGIANAPCQLSRWANNVDAASRFFESARACLDAAWQPVLRAAGLPFSPPQVRTTPSTVSSSCNGDSDSFAAFYCPVDHTIYIPYDRIQVDQYGAHPGVYLAVFAHEYGHHVQALSGVWEAYEQARQQAGFNSDRGLEYSRRTELQAQCFSGMFVGATANRGGDVNQTIYDEGLNSSDRGDHSGGQRDHGTDAHAKAWWFTGASSNRTARCNTWTSSSGDVS